jgi:hypothetical protein
VSPKRRKPLRTTRSPKPKQPSRFARFTQARSAGAGRARLVVGGIAGVAVLLLMAGLVVIAEPGPAKPPGGAVTPPAATAERAVASPAAQVSPTPRAPIVLSGTGRKQTEPFTLQSGAVRATMKHEGRQAFTVTLQDQQGNPAGGAGGLDAQLANAVGPWSGEKTTYVPSLGNYRLDVVADGAWQIALQQ